MDCSVRIKELVSIVESVREDISRIYVGTVERNIKMGKDPYYGLTDFAIHMMTRRLGDRWNKELISGDQIHSYIIPSWKWRIRHCWLRVRMNTIDYYIDATSSQFQSMYSDIPSLYVGLDPPKWYYPDYMNPQYKFKSRIIKWTIGFFQYKIWGCICDAIRLFRRRTDKKK